jgi:hypothetical protein
MLMPFAAAFGFSPISPVYGMAFWGIVASVLFVLLVHSLNPKLTILAAIISLIWYPLLETSRWAWNPHLVIFWPILAAVIFQKRQKIGLMSYFLTGLFLGFPFHHHYIAVFATTIFLVLMALKEFLQDKKLQGIYLLSGYATAFLPFLIFDLRHPPGLFFTHYLLSGNTPHMERSVDMGSFATNLARNLQTAGETLLPTGKMLWLLFFLLVLLLAYLDFKKNKRNLIWLAPVVSQLFGGVLLSEFHTRYFLPAVAFFAVWLFLPRKDLAQKAALSCLVLIIISSALTVKTQLTTTKTPPDIYTLTQAAEYIAVTIKENNLKNANIAAIKARDPSPLAEKYRDVLRLHDISTRQPPEYDISEHLFVISDRSLEEVLSDKSYAILVFKSGKYIETHQIENSSTKVYWLSR